MTRSDPDSVEAVCAVIVGFDWGHYGLGAVELAESPNWPWDLARQLVEAIVPANVAEEQQNTRLVQAILLRDVDRAREAVEQRDARIRGLVVDLRRARACLVEHVDCPEELCRAEIAKALGGDDGGI